MTASSSHLDTPAMLRLWNFFAGREEPGNLERRILQNGELVGRIVSAAQALSVPMSAEAFIAWLGKAEEDAAGGG